MNEFKNTEVSSTEIKPPEKFPEIDTSNDLDFSNVGENIQENPSSPNIDDIDDGDSSLIDSVGTLDDYIDNGDDYPFDTDAPNLDAALIEGVDEGDAGEAASFTNDIDTSDVPEDIDTSDVPEDIDTSDVPEDIDTSDEPEDIDTSDVPEDIDTSDVPEDIDTSDVPEDIDTSDVPEDIDTSDVPEDIDTSDVPEDIDTSDVPEDIDTSDVPEDIDTSDVPEETEAAEETEATEDTEADGDAETTEDTETAEDTETTEDTEADEDTDDIIVGDEVNNQHDKLDDNPNHYNRNSLETHVITKDGVDAKVFTPEFIKSDASQNTRDIPENVTPEHRDMSERNRERRNEEEMRNEEQTVGNWQSPKEVADVHTRIWNEKMYASTHEEDSKDIKTDDTEDNEDNEQNSDDTENKESSDRDITEQTTEYEKTPEDIKTNDTEDNENNEQNSDDTENKESSDRDITEQTTEYEKAFWFTVEQRIIDYGLDSDTANAVRSKLETQLDSIKILGNELEAKGLSDYEIRSIAANAAEKAFADNRPIKLEEKTSDIGNESHQNESEANKENSSDLENKKLNTLSDTLRSLQTAKGEPPGVVSKHNSVNEQDKSINNPFILQHRRNNQGR